MQDDLFEPVPCIDPKSQKDIDDAVLACPTFQRDLVWLAIIPKVRSAINSRWSEIKSLSEDNFKSEFLVNGKFYSRLWELNLRYLLRQHLSRKPRDGEPDLISDNFVVECVVPAPMDVPEPQFDGKLYDYPSDQISRRITAVLTEKLNQLEARLANPGAIDYETIPYIIAICLPDRNYMGAKGMSGMSLVEEMLIGAGPLQMTIDSARNTASISVSSRNSIDSRNGSEISVGYFQRDEYKPVAAVLWTTEYLPDPEDVEIMLNPNANIPLDTSNLPEITNVITYTRTDTGYTRDQKLKR